jgi:hypothetical protein
MDGFYAADLTGRSGNTIVLLAIRSSTVVGVDAGGMKYDGTVVSTAHGLLSFKIRYTIPPGTPLITGVGGVASPTPVSLEFTMPSDFSANSIVKIETPLGPVNARLVKLRDFDLPA